VPIDTYKVVVSIPENATPEVSQITETLVTSIADTIGIHLKAITVPLIQRLAK
jgi:hypothetical protein